MLFGCAALVAAAVPAYGQTATAPEPPTGLTATASSQTQIDLSWIAPADDGGSAITGYKIEWSADGTTNWADLVANTGSDAVTYSDAMLAAGTTRHYRVSAINSVGAGAASSVAGTTTDVPVTVTVADKQSTFEDDGGAEIVVTATTGINAQPPRSFEIQLATANGTATAFSDYIPLDLLVEFAVDDFSFEVVDGVSRWEAKKGVLVPIQYDIDIEDDETFTATLSRPEGLSPSIVLGTPKAQTITIVNDDGIDATLSSLVLNDGTNDLTLAPTFATDTTSYAASVANDIDQVTVTPETTDDGASVEYLDASDATITDADGTTEGRQVDLEVGANTIKVKVTAEDAMTTESYTVVVTRLEVQTEIEIWSATLTVGGTGTEPGPDGFCSATCWSGDHQDYGSLSDADFVTGITTHTVDSLRYGETGEALYFVVGPDLTGGVENLVLKIGDNSFSLSDAETSDGPGSQAGNTRYEWTPVDRPWTEATTTSAETVAVKLVRLGADEVLVSNMHVDDTVQYQIALVAQRFTTGSNVAGYTLDGIDIVAGTNRGASVALHTVDQSGFPDALHASLTAPGSFARGTRSYTAPADTILAADTTYTLVIEALELFEILASTYSGCEDSGAAAGWSIADAFDSKSSGNWAPGLNPEPFRIAIKGVAVSPPENIAPEFTDEACTTRSVAENTAAGINVGAPVAATDADGDTLTYTLGGTDAASFDIVSSNGRIQTKSGVTYDHETKSSYAVTVTVADGEGGSDSIAVTINVTDVNEQPATPAAPTVSATAGASDSLDVGWTAPGLNGGPDLTGYELRYRTGGGAWSDLPHTGTGTSASVTGLAAGTSYDVQVRALNGETPSGWSSSGTGSTGAAVVNNAPVFTDGASTTRSVAENTAAGMDVGAAVAATDADSGDTLTYALGGTDAASFDIVSTSGQIRTKSGVVYDHETKSSHAVTVSVADGEGGSDSIAVTVNVTDVNEQPDAPAAPSVSATAGASDSLDVGWTAPGLNGGPALTGYELRYRTGGGAWSSWPHTGTGTSATVTGLAAGTSYDVQVRALNGETPSGWSSSGTGSTGAAANNAPAFTDGASTTRGVAENTAAGNNVGAAVAATDADSGDTLTYALGGTDAASFDIVSTSGQIRTKSGVVYDYETKSSYAVTVSVADGEGGTDSIAVTVNVTDVDEPATSTATMIVGVSSGGTTFGYKPMGTDTYGSFSPTGFDVGGTTYTVLVLIDSQSPSEVPPTE